MVSFNQWRMGLKKNPAPRQVTWICGSERVLVDDVVEYILDYLGPEPWNYVPLVVGEDSERTVWTAADQHPMGGSPRVLVIRNAEQLTQWDRFEHWVKNRTLNPRTYMVLISGEDKVPRIEPTPEARRKGAKSEIVPHLAMLGTRGHVIECRPYTSATAKHSLEWVQSKVRMRDGVARHLLERADFDLRLVRDTCRKLAAFPSEITLSVVNALLIERPRDSFTDALLALDKKTALLALRDIDTSDYGRIIGLLDSRLDLAGTVHDMQVEHRSPTEMARALGAQAFLVKDIIKVAKHYDARRRLAIRKILASVDEAYRSGQTIGILEAVVAFW